MFLKAFAVVTMVCAVIVGLYIARKVGAEFNKRRSVPEPPAIHFNPGSWRSLPPVDCPLLIKVDGVVLCARRVSHIERPDGDMDYVTDDGHLLVGRFDWTYP